MVSAADVSAADVSAAVVSAAVVSEGGGEGGGGEGSQRGAGGRCADAKGGGGAPDQVTCARGDTAGD